MSVLTLISSALHIKLTQISLVDHKPKKIWGSVFDIWWQCQACVKAAWTAPFLPKPCPLVPFHLLHFPLSLSRLLVQPQNKPEWGTPPSWAEQGGSRRLVCFLAALIPSLVPLHTVAQHKGGILVEKKGCSSQMHTAKIREMLREGLQLLPLKSCWPTAYKSALLVLMAGLVPGKRPIAKSRVALKTAINALEFNFMLLEI